ncbi:MULTISPECIES: hypothetical protein [Listeria]|uniref:hypothetical protein n=1 Tax=Listeria TaxID=1637 RepID=UPI001357797F|nr:MULTISPECIES: hypothetical protein [Listeria]EHK4067735.1 hypothetical protein [Listeria monocytogenes]MBC1904695.1 hypothetical protein [Listeria innocua]MBC2238712.1 hypothetical protein [Listeria innocua]
MLDSVQLVVDWIGQKQKEARIKKLDKRVNQAKHSLNQTFLAPMPLLENGQ